MGKDIRAGRMEATGDRTAVAIPAGRMETTEDRTADEGGIRRRRGATVVRAVIQRRRVATVVRAVTVAVQAAVSTAVRAAVIAAVQDAVQVDTAQEVRTEADIAKLNGFHEHKAA
jgi:hypothetical protein